MVDVVDELNDDELANRHKCWHSDFGCFHSKHNFLTFSMECKCILVDSSQSITFVYSRIDWRGSLWTKMFKRPLSKSEGLPEHGKSFMSMTLFQTRKPFSCYTFFNDVLSVNGTNGSMVSDLLTPLKLKQKNMSGCSFFLQDTFFLCK